MLLDHLKGHAGLFYENSSRYAWHYLVISYGAALFFYLVIRRKSLNHYWRDSLSPATWYNSSGWVDLIFFFVYSFSILDFAVGWSPGQHMKWVRNLFVSQDTGMFPEIAQYWWARGAWSIAMLFVVDFGGYISHRIAHETKLLWPFHAVHHSANHLNLTTAARIHPLDAVLNGTVIGLAFGSFLYISTKLFGHTPMELTVLGAPFYFPLRAIISNFRHSQVWIYFPNWLSHLIISPAMHQIHHSKDPRHFNKNLALDFACIDWFFGTLYIPDREEDANLRFGVSREHAIQPGSLLSCLWQPFKNLAAQLNTHPGAPNAKIPPRK